MKNPVIISYDFFKQVLSLAEYLEHSSQSLICLIDGIDGNDAYEKEFIKNLNGELLSLNNRAYKIKEGLVYAVVRQEKILNSNELFKDSIKKISVDFRKIHEICKEISETNYFINAEGKLTK